MELIKQFIELQFNDMKEHISEIKSDVKELKQKQVETLVEQKRTNGRISKLEFLSKGFGIFVVSFFAITSFIVLALVGKGIISYTEVIPFIHK